MKDISKLPESEQRAIIARREYFRKWRNENKSKVKEYNKRYWERKAEQTASAE